MEGIHYVKVNLLLLLAVIPLSLGGYLLAVYKESLFFLYEWLLVLLIIGIASLSLWSLSRISGPLRWLPLSVLAFLGEFAVLGLFLGPLTYYYMFFFFYAVAAASVITLVRAFKKLEVFRFVPILFLILSALFIFYISILHQLWGNSLA